MPSTSPRKVYVVGVGMTNFIKPGSVPGWDYPDMVKESVHAALKDCNIDYGSVDQCVVGYIFGSNCSGQRAMYEVGMTGIPLFNVNNACASGSSGLFLGKQIIQSGNADCVLAVGFEKMVSGSLENMGGMLSDRANPVDKHVEVINETYGFEPAPATAQMFGNAAREHMEKYGSTKEHLAKIAYKNHKHSVNNPRSQFRKEYSLEEILNSRMVHDPLTKLQCCPTSDGSAAAILCSEDFLRTHPHLKDRAVEVLGMQLTTDLPSAFNEKSNMKMIGYDMAQLAADKLYKSTGLTANEAQVIELHDCFSANELITYEAIRLCPPGGAGKLIDANDNTYGGKWVINPSGGLISKGHPIGATGVAQVVELCLQLRNEAGLRQVSNCRIALQHNVGIGGACFMGMYKLAFPKFGASVAQIPSIRGPVFSSDVVFNEIKQRASTPEGEILAQKVASSYRFIINNTDGQKKEWTIDMKSKPFFVGEKQGKVDCEITVSDKDFLAIAKGDLKPDRAFMQGKMKLKGNVAKAMKLKDILNPTMIKSKL